MAFWGWIHLAFLLLGAVDGGPSTASPGATGPIQTQRTVWTAAGEDAHLSCQLLETKDVLQVTWQKIFKDEEKEVCSCNDSSLTVNPELKNKVEFKEAGLQNTSIVIRNVSEQDEGCYFCSFRTFPDGVRTAGTCLHVYEMHGPVLHVREPDSPEESVVSCSATGRPAPTVTLTVTQQHLHFSQHNTVTVTNTNTNNTVTVTTTAVLSGLHDDSTQVGCAVKVDSGPQMEVMKRISELKQMSDDDLEKKSKLDQDRNRWFLFGPVCLVVAVCVAFVIFVRRRNNSSQSDLQTNGLSEITTIDPQRTEEAELSQEKINSQ